MWVRRVGHGRTGASGLLCSRCFSRLGSGARWCIVGYFPHVFVGQVLHPPDTSILLALHSATAAYLIISVFFESSSARYPSASSTPLQLCSSTALQLKQYGVVRLIVIQKITLRRGFDTATGLRSSKPT